MTRLGLLMQGPTRMTPLRSPWRAIHGRPKVAIFVCPPDLTVVEALTITQSLLTGRLGDHPDTQDDDQDDVSE